MGQHQLRALRFEELGDHRVRHRLGLDGGVPLGRCVSMIDSIRGARWLGWVDDACCKRFEVRCNSSDLRKDKPQNRESAPRTLYTGPSAPASGPRGRPTSWLWCSCSRCCWMSGSRNWPPSRRARDFLPGHGAERAP
jgi:hypothetical protein